MLWAITCSKRPFDLIAQLFNLGNYQVASSKTKYQISILLSIFFKCKCQKKRESSLTQESNIVEMSNWCQNILNTSTGIQRMPNLATSSSAWGTNFNFRWCQNLKLLAFLSPARGVNAPNGEHKIHVHVSVHPEYDVTLCVRLRPNRLTYLHILGASFQIQDKVTKNLVFCILYIRWVVLCVCDSAQTASHICIYLGPINCTLSIIVDVQHTFHFDIDLISDPGQGHKNLVFSACFI